MATLTNKSVQYVICLKQDRKDMYNLTLRQGCAMAQAVVSGLSPRKPWFNTRPVHMGFVVDKMAVGYIFLQILWSSLVGIIPPMPRTHLSLTLHFSNWQCR